MYRLLLALLLAASTNAGTVHGVVLEHASGNSMARTNVHLVPVPTKGSKAPQAQVTRTGLRGQFTFPTVAPGSYLLIAERAGYFPASHGQRRPAGRGRAFQVTEDSNLFSELRLRHKGAIIGRVLDENGVGAIGVWVVAYRAQLPFRSAGDGVSDDRGMFRIHSLQPGKYWVRTRGHSPDQYTSWLPTFSPQGREPRDAGIYSVTLDNDTSHADVRPDPGNLFSLSGEITCDKPTPLAVTLSSPTSHQTIGAVCDGSPATYLFNNLAPGQYELLAVSPDSSAAAFMEFNIVRSSSVNLSLSPASFVNTEVHRAGSRAPAGIAVKVIARRASASDADEPRELKPRTRLAPGHWEMRAEPPAGYYIELIQNPDASARRARAGRAPDWFDVFIDPAHSLIRVTLSDQVGKISGTVWEEGKRVGGAPVFLWPVSEANRRSLGGPRQTLSDTDGDYVFEDLPPGEYRIVSSFDVSELDLDFVEASRATIVQAKALQTTTLELTLWTAPY